MTITEEKKSLAESVKKLDKFIHVRRMKEAE